MTRFLVATVPVIGHVGPAVPIVRKLVERGHDVRWYTGSAFRSMVEATGACFTPMATAFDYSDLANITAELTNERNSLQGIAQLKFDVKHFFIDSAPAQVTDCLELLRKTPADVLLVDPLFIGASWLHEKGGPPWAEYGVSVLMHKSWDAPPFGLGLTPGPPVIGRLRNRILHWVTKQMVFRELSIYTDQLRSNIGLPKDSKGIFDIRCPFLHIAGTVPSFEYPRRDLPPQVHFVGPLLPESPAGFNPPAWWDELGGEKQVVLVTQGTVATEQSDLITPALTALGGEDMLIVVTTGGRQAIEMEHLPINARVEPFLPYAALLPHVNVMVTNGGYGGVHFALAHGVPLVVAGKSEDKADVCARVEWAKVGINLKTKTPTPQQISAAVKKVLIDPTYKANAKAIQAEMAQYDGPNTAVDLLERLARTGQPIPRSS
jgi:UDP:flavonoid glycosyltransferase YjiC (YdhE family)